MRGHDLVFHAKVKQRHELLRRIALVDEEILYVELVVSGPAEAQAGAVFGDLIDRCWIQKIVDSFVVNLKI